MLTAFAALAMLIAAQAAPVGPPAPVAAPAAATEVYPVDVKGKIQFGVVEGKNVQKSEKVCFNDPISGSKIPTKRCHPRAEFEQRQRDARAYTNQIQNDARAPISR